jgi:uncharacterized protein
MDSWAGIGHVAVGMHRQGYDLQMTRYDERGWRATFYTTGMEHSPTSATGTGWQRTPWHATQRAAGRGASGCVQGGSMTVAEDLLRRHIETLVADNARWQTMLADDVVWELPFAPAIGHPARVSGRAEVVQFAAWFVGAVENFRFFDVRVQAFANPEEAVAEVKGEGRIKATGRSYRQEYVVFLRAVEGKIAFLREYFDPTRAAKAMNAPILDRDS